MVRLRCLYNKVSVGLTGSGLRKTPSCDWLDKIDAKESAGDTFADDWPDLTKQDNSDEIFALYIVWKL